MITDKTNSKYKLIVSLKKIYINQMLLANNSISNHIDKNIQRKIIDNRDIEEISKLLLLSDTLNLKLNQKINESLEIIEDTILNFKHGISVD